MFFYLCLTTRLSNHNIMHYLEIFLFAERITCRDYAEFLQHFLDVIELGIPLCRKKTEGPITTVTFGVIRLDTVKAVS